MDLFYEKSPVQLSYRAFSWRNRLAVVAGAEPKPGGYIPARQVVGLSLLLLV